jgi:hypothetical protein
MSEKSIEELRFQIIKNILTDFPELKERVREYLREDNEKKEETD